MTPLTSLRTPIKMAVIITVMALVAISCSSEPDPDPVQAEANTKSLAEQMIVDDLAATIGLGPLVASCNEPGPLAVGITFDCMATTEPGEVIAVQGLVRPDGHLALKTTNLISAAALPSFEREAAASLNNTVGSNFTAESVDCGTSAVVLPSGAELGCALVIPASGEIFDLTLTVTDLDNRHFGLLVGDQPRA